MLGCDLCEASQEFAMELLEAIGQKTCPGECKLSLVTLVGADPIPSLLVLELLELLCWSWACPRPIVRSAWLGLAHGEEL